MLTLHIYIYFMNRIAIILLMLFQYCSISYYKSGNRSIIYIKLKVKVKAVCESYSTDALRHIVLLRK